MIDLYYAFGTLKYIHMCVLASYMAQYDYDMRINNNY